MPNTWSETPTTFSSTATVLASSDTPRDDAALYASHPFLGCAAEGWYSAAGYGGFAGLGVAVYQFGSPADADAVLDRWLYQFSHRLEQMATSYTGITIAESPRDGYRRFAVLHYIHNTSTRRITTRYLATIGPYVLGIAGGQPTKPDGALITPAIDPVPAMDYVLAEMASRFNAAGIFR